MSDFDRIDEVVAHGLCVMCGTCAGICPTNAIIFDEKDFPNIDLDTCTNCGLCIQVCPGYDVNFPELYSRLFDDTSGLQTLTGNFDDVFCAYATEESIRRNGAGGGVVTQLLAYLLEKKEVGSAVVVCADEAHPWESKPRVVRKRRELRKCSQSRYTIVPVNQVLNQVSKIEGKIALVGMPCHIQGVRKAMEVNKALKEKIYITIGLFCELNIEKEATEELIKLRKIPFGEIEKFQYRAGDWPGHVKVWLKDGTNRQIEFFDHISDTLNYLKCIYFVERCLSCIDLGSELADISVADAWIRDHRGEWYFKGSVGWNTVIVRTETGKEVIKNAINDGALGIKRLPQEYIFNAYNRLAGHKKSRAYSRMKFLKKKGLKFPDYHFDLSSIVGVRCLKWELYRVCAWVRKIPFVRYLVIRIAFSVLGITFIKFKTRLKKRKFRNSVKLEEM